MVKLNHEQMNELVNHLQGTCLSMHEALYQMFNVDENDIENELEMCEHIDNAIFLCRECGWWFENGYWNPEGFEAGNGEVCLDCMPEEEE